MRRSIRILILSAISCIAAATAQAQLTVDTDATQYSQADIVTVTVHNAGPSLALFASSPPFFIYRIGTSECVYGCVGLPILWEMNAGETIVTVYDPSEDAGPDPIGWYRVELNGTSSDPGSILHCDYQMLEVVPIGSGSWGGVKALYR
ncbi:hypothetical protein HGA89_06980 [bacterium]|nr:hypothetical protein [bacterium]